MSAMKLQFSLAMLLAFATVLAIVFAACAAIKLQPASITGVAVASDAGVVGTFQFDHHQATLPELLERLLWSIPLALASTCCLIVAIRRLKSRRENGPPV